MVIRILAACNKWINNNPPEKKVCSFYRYKTENIITTIKKTTTLIYPLSQNDRKNYVKTSPVLISTKKNLIKIKFTSLIYFKKKRKDIFLTFPKWLGIELSLDRSILIGHGSSISNVGMHCINIALLIRIATLKLCIISMKLMKIELHFDIKTHFVAAALKKLCIWKVPKKILYSKKTEKNNSARLIFFGKEI